MEWLATILTTLIGAMSGVDPIVYLCLIVMGGLGYGWNNEKLSADIASKDATIRFDAMLASMNARADARDAVTQAALDEAHRQLAALNKDYSSANKDTAEIVNQVAQTLSTLATTLQDEHKGRRV